MTAIHNKMIVKFIILKDIKCSKVAVKDLNLHTRGGSASLIGPPERQRKNRVVMIPAMMIMPAMIDPKIKGSVSISLSLGHA
jgi:hypothetical protein